MKGDFDKMIVFFVFLELFFKAKTLCKHYLFYVFFFDFMAVVKGIFFILVFPFPKKSI